MKLDDDYELSTCYVDDFGLSNKGIHPDHPGDGPQPSHYIDYCKNYVNGDSPVCAICRDGY